MDNQKAIAEIVSLINHGFISHSDLIDLAAIAYAEEAGQDAGTSNE